MNFQGSGFSILSKTLGYYPHKTIRWTNLRADKIELEFEENLRNNQRDNIEVNLGKKLGDNLRESVPK